MVGAIVRFHFPPFVLAEARFASVGARAVTQQSDCTLSQALMQHHFPRLVRHFARLRLTPIMSAPPRAAALTRALGQSGRRYIVERILQDKPGNQGRVYLAT